MGVTYCHLTTMCLLLFTLLLCAYYYVLTTMSLLQFLLEELVAEGRGGEAAVVVAQPRRVSAISLAQRVAAERGEPVGKSVGYAVR